MNGKTLVVKSRRDINPNEEVTITYGNHCNEVFAIQYFFVPKNNPNDVLYMQLRREMTCMRLAKYDGMSVDETKSNFIPFGFVEYGNGDAMKIAKVVHPEDPDEIPSLEIDQNASRIRKEHDYPNEKEAHDEEYQSQIQFKKSIMVRVPAAESSVNKHPYTGYTSQIKKAWLESTS